MQRFVRWMARVLAILFVCAIPADAARAQNPFCALEFTTSEIDYDRKQLRVVWTREGPAEASEVWLQIDQNGTVVDPVTKQDWRVYDSSVTTEAILDVSNLQSNAFLIKAKMLFPDQTLCKGHDGNSDLAVKELKWDPPSLQFVIVTNPPDYAKNSVSVQVRIQSMKQSVMYTAGLRLNGQPVGAAEGIGSTNPFVIEIQVPRNVFDFRSKKEAIQSEWTVAVGYSADDMFPKTEQSPFGPEPAVGLMERLGNIVLAVLNNPPIVTAILLILGVMVVFQSVHRPKPTKPAIPSETADLHLHQESDRRAAIVQFHTTPAVRARIVQDGDPAHEIVLNIETFPFIFGRNNGLEHGQTVTVEGNKFLNLRGDRAISRHHFQLVRTGQHFGVNVLSRNGAQVNGRALGQQDTVHIATTATTEVKIGEQTKIELTLIHLT
jgi:hypothetical protein